MGIFTFKNSKKCKKIGFFTAVNSNVILTKSLIIGVILLVMGVMSVNAQITQVGTTQSVYSTSSNLTLNKPTGVTVGDIMIVNIAKYKSGNITNPSLSGWTVIASGLGGNTSRIGAVLYRVVDGTEGSSFTFALGGTMSNAEGTIVAYGGIDHSSPFDVTPPLSITTAVSTGKTVNITSIITNTPNALVLMLGMSSNSTISTFTWSITSPVLTELYDVSGTSVVSVGAAAAIKPTVGATGTGTVTASVTTYLGGIILALKPQKQFHSITSGNWNSTSTWQQSTDGGATWQTATTTPVNTDGLVTIQSGNTVTISASTTASNLTINGTLDLSSSTLTGTSIMTVSSTGTLIVGGTTNFPTGFTTTTLSSGSTVNYDKAGAQTVSGIAYSNLTLSGSGTKTLQIGTTSIGGNLTLTGTATATEVVNLSIGGDLNVGSGTTLDLATFNANRTSAGGTLTVAGTMILGGSTGGQTGSNFPTNFSSTVLTGGTVNYDNSAGGQTIFSTPTYNHLTLGNTSGSQTAGGNLTVLGNFVIGSGGPFLAGTYTHAIGGNMTGGSITASTSTINLNGTTQTVDPYNFNNLTISNTGVKTFATSPTINGILSMEGTASVNVTSGAVNYGAYATLQYNKPAAYTTTSEEWITPFVALGGVVIANTGVITMNTAKVFNTSVPLKILNSASLVTNNFQLNFGGDFINNSGTFTAGSSPIFIENTAPTQSIDGFITTGTVSMTKTSGTATFAHNVTTGGFTLSGSGGILNLGVGLNHTISGTFSMSNGSLQGGSSTFNLNGFIYAVGGSWSPGTSTVNYGGSAQTILPVQYYNLTLSGSSTPFLYIGTSIVNNLALSGTVTVTAVEGITIPGSFTISGSATFNAGSYSHNIAGNWINNGGTFNANGSTINLYGSTAQTIGGSVSTTFNNLSINNTSGGVLLNLPQTISNTLTLTSGILTTSLSSLLSITNSSTNAISGGTTSSFLNGPVIWRLPSGLVSGSTYIFPVGKNTTYLPFSLVNPTTGSTTTPTAQVEAFDSGSGGTADGTTLSSISTTESWSLATYGSFTNSSVSLARQTPITPFNVVGGSIAQGGVYNSLDGTESINGVSMSNAIGSNRFFVLAKKPTITISTTTLNGFSYPVGYGPSNQLISFTVSGVNLSTNISVLPTDSFEISLSSGASFAPQSLITLLVNNGTVAMNTIYVRMKAGFNVGNIIPIKPITCSSDNAITRNIICSGTVINLPVISVAPSSLSGFNYNVGSGPSSSQSFTVSGVNLSSNLVITPPTDYEISTSSGGTYQSTPLTYSPSGGTVTPKNIYVRLMTGLTGGSYIENIVASTATTTTTVIQNITLSGSVNQPAVNVSILNLGGFIYTAGSGITSGEQSFTVSGQYLSTNLIITAPANFEISLVSKGTFSSTISLTQTNGIVASTLIYVRMISGITAGTLVDPINLTVTTTGAIQQNVALSGKVVNSATSISSNAALTGFVYPNSFGPSVIQSFNVSGTSLGIDNITVTAPSNFEISKDASSWSPSFDISPIGGLVNSVPVYIRLKAGLNVGPYSGSFITLTSRVATTVNITCNGVVITAPSITAGPSNLGSTCNNATISFTASGTGVTGYTWNGPNNFYSATQNPVLSNVTSANNGIYTVSGSALSGVNLLTNGDFSLGNTGFGSSYTYHATGSTDEGIYFIVANPNLIHSGFCACADHTTGSITAGSQMVINGSTTTGTIAWSESVSVVPGANYQFSYWVQTVSAAGNPGKLQLYVNGSPTGSVFTATTNENGWFQYIGNINSGQSNVLQLTLINNDTQASGNDFALDDIVFQQAFTVTSSVTLTVNPTLPVSVGITASISPLYSGGSVTFTAAPVNGGTTPTYQWKVNGSNFGTNSITYTYTPAANDQITCILTSNYPCPSGNPAVSNILTATGRSYFWVGTNSTDWGTPSNWSGGFIPSPGNDVEYASTLNAYGSNAVRDLQLDQNRTIGSLVNSTFKRLIIPAGLGLIVNNTISTNNADSLIYIKSNSTDANGSLIFHNAAGAPVHATVEMYSKAFYDVAGATNQKYHWQYFGIPVSQVAASPTFDGSYLRSWDETGDAITNHWISLTNGSVLQPFMGYEITQKTATTIIFKGQLVNTDFNSGPLSYTPLALFPGQHIYANPYTAAIDIRQLTFGAQTEATVYLYNTGTYDQWTETTGADNPGTGAGQYISVPKNTAGSSSLPRQIPSMQALLVKALSPSSDATFGITYNTVIMNNTDPQRVPGINYQSGTDKVSTLIDVKGTNYSDKMWLFSQPGCTQSFDNGWDGAKIPGIAFTPQIFALGADGNYQVNAVDDINNTFLGFQAGQDVAYTMTFTHQNLKSKYEAVFLVDLVENKTVDITESGSTYSFNAESTPTFVKRFMIATRNIEKDAVDTNTQLKVFTTGNVVFIQNLGSLTGEVNIYNMSGRYIKKASFGPYGVTSIQVGTIPGAYVVNATTNTERVSKRIILGK